MPGGQAGRRGPLSAGDRVQVTDPKGRLHTVTLVSGGHFQTNRGSLNHDDVLGKPDGQIVEIADGKTFQVMRPLLSDYVLSMPRGAAIIYPKDSGQILQLADVFPGARVLEAGVGSGALSLSLLSALGPDGLLHSVEQREEFAAIAAANVDLWFAGRHPAWELEVGNVGDALELAPAHFYDRVILDLLDPWEYVEGVAHALAPGGVFLSYVATVPQMSRVVEALRASGMFSNPHSVETLVRSWHVEGLSVRPDHRMVSHTGFLITARRLAPGSATHALTRRPAPAASGKGGEWDDVEEWTLESLGMRSPNAKKLRRLRRDVEGRVARWLDEHAAAAGATQGETAEGAVQDQAATEAKRDEGATRGETTPEATQDKEDQEGPDGQ